MREHLRRWAFTLFGLITMGLFLLVEVLWRADVHGAGVAGLHAVVRVLIIPLWLMRYAVVALGGLLFGFGGSFPGWYNILMIPVLLLPYIALDLLRSGNRRLTSDLVSSASPRPSATPRDTTRKEPGRLQ